MRRGVIVAIALCVAAAQPAAAQSPAGKLLYDQCYPDLDIWDVACDIHLLADGSDTVLVPGGMLPKWSPDGLRFAFTYLYSYDVFVFTLADGSIANLTDPSAIDTAYAWSPDGAKIAFVSDPYPYRSPQLYVMNADGSHPTRLTYDAGFTGSFAWSPDSGAIAFARDAGTGPELYVMAADGSGPTRLTNHAGFAEPFARAFAGPFSWSADGGRIAFDCVAADGYYHDICAINADGSGFLRRTNDPPNDTGAVFAPAGSTLAFVTTRFGADPEIALLRADGTIVRVAAGTGGVQPVWAPGGGVSFVGTTPSGSVGFCYEGSLHNADDFCMSTFDIYLASSDGTGLTAIATGRNPDWFEVKQ